MRRQKIQQQDEQHEVPVLSSSSAVTKNDGHKKEAKAMQSSSTITAKRSSKTSTEKERNKKTEESLTDPNNNNNNNNNKSTKTSSDKKQKKKEKKTTSIKEPSEAKKTPKKPSEAKKTEAKSPTLTKEKKQKQKRKSATATATTLPSDTLKPVKSSVDNPSSNTIKTPSAPVPASKPAAASSQTANIMDPPGAISSCNSYESAPPPLSPTVAPITTELFRRSSSSGSTVFFTGQSSNTSTRSSSSSSSSSRSSRYPSSSSTTSTTTASVSPLDVSGNTVHMTTTTASTSTSSNHRDSRTRPPIVTEDTKTMNELLRLQSPTKRSTKKDHKLGKSSSSSHHHHATSTTASTTTSTTGHGPLPRKLPPPPPPPLFPPPPPDFHWPLFVTPPSPLPLSPTKRRRSHRRLPSDVDENEEVKEQNRLRLLLEQSDPRAGLHSSTTSSRSPQKKSSKSVHRNSWSDLNRQELLPQVPFSEAAVPSPSQRRRRHSSADLRGTAAGAATTTISASSLHNKTNSRSESVPSSKKPKRKSSTKTTTLIKSQSEHIVQNAPPPASVVLSTPNRRRRHSSSDLRGSRTTTNSNLLHTNSSSSMSEISPSKKASRKSSATATTTFTTPKPKKERIQRAPVPPGEDDFDPAHHHTQLQKSTSKDRHGVPVEDPLSLRKSSHHSHSSRHDSLKKKHHSLSDSNVTSDGWATAATSHSQTRTDDQSRAEEENGSTYKYVSSSPKKHGTSLTKAVVAAAASDATVHGHVFTHKTGQCKQAFSQLTQDQICSQHLYHIGQSYKSSSSSSSNSNSNSATQRKNDNLAVGDANSSPRRQGRSRKGSFSAESLKSVIVPHPFSTTSTKISKSLVAQQVLEVLPTNNHEMKYKIALLESVFDEITVDDAGRSTTIQPTRSPTTSFAKKQEQQRRQTRQERRLSSQRDLATDQGEQDDERNLDLDAAGDSTVTSAPTALVDSGDAKVPAKRRRSSSSSKNKTNNRNGSDAAVVSLPARDGGDSLDLVGKSSSKKRVEDRYPLEVVDLEKGLLLEGEEISDNPRKRSAGARFDYCLSRVCKVEQDRGNCRLWIVMILCLLVVGIVAASVIASIATQDTGGPLAVETLAPTSLQSDVLPWYTKLALQHPSSPQAKAFYWMEQDEQRSGMTTSQAVQRFALATLFFATRGDQWKRSDDWLVYAKSECTWFRKEFPSVCNPAEQVHTLSLPNNNLRGTLPEELELLSSMNIVQLQNNGITGSLPNLIWSSWDQLVYLNLFNNSLAGSIPFEISALSNARLLNTLSFRSNLLTGSIPSSLGMLGLEFLSLSGNNFTGGLPSELGLLSNAKDLYFHSNQLSGTIPSSFGMLTKLTQLELHNNGLVGSVPREVCTLVSEGNLTRLTVDCEKVSCQCGCDCTATKYPVTR